MTSNTINGRAISQVPLLSRIERRDSVSYGHNARNPGCILLFLLLLLSAGTVECAQAQQFAELDPSRVEQIAQMLSARPSGFGTPCAERAAWNGKTSALQGFVAQASQIIQKPLPAFNAESYLAFTKTGDRAPMESNLHDRSDQLTPLVMAECAEFNGRYLPRIAEVMDSLAAQPSWTLSAHDFHLLNFKGERYFVDLNAADMGDTLAEALYLLGDRIPQATRGRVIESLEKHVFGPMRLSFRIDGPGKVDPLDKGQSWIHENSNWNAVCLKGVTGAALAILPEIKDRAVFVAAAEHYIQYYAKGFNPDGYDPEGLSYWNYGFSHFLELRENILRVTGGKIDLLADVKMQRAALFGLQFQMLPGNSASFGDVAVMPRADTNLLATVERIFKLPQTDPIPATSADFRRMNLTSIMLDLFPLSGDQLASDVARQAALQRLQTYYADSGILVSRPASGQGLAIAIKAGGNTEHSHNDIGSFALAMKDTQLVADPGGPGQYDGTTFGPHRLDSKLLNSFGHPVPEIGGQLQLDATKVKVAVTAHSFSDASDSITIDMTNAYAVPALKRVTRTMIHSRAGPGSVTITDVFDLSAPTEIIESLPTHGAWAKIDDRTLSFSSGNEKVRVTFNAPVAPAFTATSINDYKNAFTRVEVHLPLTRSGKVTMSFTPDD
jgi:hypothetical protein